jgi:hypothetical protein
MSRPTALASALMSMLLGLVSLEVRAEESLPFRCLELPGASRSELAVTSDRRVLTWMMHNPQTAQNELYAYDISTGGTRVVGSGLKFGRLTAGRAVGLVPIEPKATRRHGLKLGDHVIVPSPDLTIIRFVVDEPRARVFYSAVHLVGGPPSVWSVPIAGGEPVEVVVNGTLVGVVPDGSALLIKVLNQNSMELVRHPLEGSPPSTLATDYGSGQLVGGRVFYNPEVSTGFIGPLKSISASGGSALLLEGDAALTLTLSNGNDIARSWGPWEGSRTLYRLDAEGGATVAMKVEGAEVLSATMMPDGKRVAMLLVHDTNDDGKFEGTDEVDVCVGATSALAVYKVNARKVPKEYLPLVTIAPAIAKGDLDGASVRLEQDRGRAILVIETQRAWEGDEAALFDRGIEVWKAFLMTLEFLGERGLTRPRVVPDLLIRWRGNERHVGFVQRPELKVPLPVAGAYGLSVMSPKYFTTKVWSGLQTVTNFTWSKPHIHTCKGKVQNLGPEPVEMEVECQITESGVNVPVAVGRLSLGQVKPGEIKPYNIKSMGTDNLVTKYDLVLRVNGKTTDWHNGHISDELQAFIAMADRIRAATGFSLDGDAVTHRPPSLSVEHEAPRLIAPGFSILPPKEQQRIAKLLWKEVEAHYREVHEKEMVSPPQIIEPGQPDRTVSRNGLSKIK